MIIKKKMDQRPIVNTRKDSPTTVPVPSNNAITLSPGSAHHFVTPDGCMQVRLHVSACEPGDELKVVVTANESDGNFAVTTLQYPVQDEHYGTELDVTSEYRDLYKEYI